MGAKVYITSTRSGDKIKQEVEKIHLLSIRLILLLGHRNRAVLLFKVSDTVVDQIHDLSTGAAIVIFCNIMEFLQDIGIDTNTDMLLLFHLPHPT